MDDTGNTSVLNKDNTENVMEEKKIETIAETKNESIIANKCDFDGFKIEYKCDNNNINATITRGNDVSKQITVGKNNVFNLDYKNQDNFIEMIFKCNKESVKKDIVSISQNITDMTGVDAAF